MYRYFMRWEYSIHICNSCHAIYEIAETKNGTVSSAQVWGNGEWELGPKTETEETLDN